MVQYASSVGSVSALVEGIKQWISFYEFELNFKCKLKFECCYTQSAAGMRVQQHRLGDAALTSRFPLRCQPLQTQPCS